MPTGPQLDAATVLLQWASGGLLFLWVTTRRKEVGPGYGWLLRGSRDHCSVGCNSRLWVASEPTRDLAATAIAVIAIGTLLVSIAQRPSEEATKATPGDKRHGSYNPQWDLIAPLVGLIGLVAAGTSGGGNELLQTARIVIGAAFLGSVTDAMLLGHWYLVQPGLRREPLIEQVSWLGKLWPVEVGLLLIPTGMFSVLSGTIDDSYGGMLGWFWAARAHHRGTGTRHARRIT